MAPFSSVRGRTDRIALIHAVYAAIWIGIAYAAGLNFAVTVIGLVASVLLIGLTVTALGRGVQTAGPDLGLEQRRTGVWIRRVNIATGLVAVMVIVGAHQLGRDDAIVPGVLIVMAVHFVPLWRVLRRPSLLIMGVALLINAVVGTSTPAWVAPTLAAIVFGMNAARLWLERPAPS